MEKIILYSLITALVIVFIMILVEKWNIAVYAPKWIPLDCVFCTAFWLSFFTFGISTCLSLDVSYMSLILVPVLSLLIYKGCAD